MPGLDGLFAYEDYASAQQPVIFFEREQISVLVLWPNSRHAEFRGWLVAILSGSALLHGGCKTMMRMVATRLASSALTILVLVTLVFFMVHLTPGGPAYSILGQKATAASVAQLNARLGLNQPLLSQYGIWWWHLAHGQLGYSYLLNRPVGQLLWQYMRNTLVLYTVSIVVKHNSVDFAGAGAGRVFRALAGKDDRCVAAWVLRAAGFFCGGHAGVVVLGGSALAAGEWDDGFAVGASGDRKLRGASGVAEGHETISAAHTLPRCRGILVRHNCARNWV